MNVVLAKKTNIFSCPFVLFVYLFTIRLRRLIISVFTNHVLFPCNFVSLQI